MSPESPPRAVAIALSLFALACGDPAPSSMALLDSSVVPPIGDASVDCSAATLESFELSGAQHVDAPVYSDLPPVGGDHLGCWANLGVHDSPVDAGNWVHNLEHGAVVVLHNCETPCDAELSSLVAFTGDRVGVLMTPYPDLPTRFALVAWGHRLMMDCVDDAALAKFYDEHFDRAPESVPSGKPPGC